MYQDKLNFPVYSTPSGQDGPGTQMRKSIRTESGESQRNEEKNAVRTAKMMLKAYYTSPKTSRALRPVRVVIRAHRATFSMHTSFLGIMNYAGMSSRVKHSVYLVSSRR